MTSDEWTEEVLTRLAQGIAGHRKHSGRTREKLNGWNATTGR